MILVNHNFRYTYFFKTLQIVFEKFIRKLKYAFTFLYNQT